MNGMNIMETTQYPTFKLDDEIFALDISKVREVLDFTSITDAVIKHKQQRSRRR